MNVVSVDDADRAVVAIVLGATRFPDWPAIDDEAVGLVLGTSHHDVVAILKTFTSAVLDLFDSDHLPDALCLDIERFLKGHKHATDLVVYYVGHGSFLPDSDSAYFLALRKTAADSEYATGLRAASLSRSLRTFKERTYLLLDCCFAGSALPHFLSPLQDVIGAEFKPNPDPRGLALLSAASRNKPAVIPKSAGRTMFSDALCDILRGGIPGAGPRLTLRQIKELASERIRTKFAAERHALPEIHTPRQIDGDVADFPFFPNVAANAIPLDVLANLEKPERWARVSAVSALVELLKEGRPGPARAAREKLEQLVEDDSKYVARLASEGLANEKTAREQREEQARLAAEKKVREEQVRRARLAADLKARQDQAEQARLAAEEKARQEQEEQARLAAERKAQEEQKEQARLADERAAREEQGRQARLAAEKRALQEPERLARIAAEKKATEEQAMAAAKKRQDEQALQKERDDQARIAAEEKAREEQDRFEAESKAREEEEAGARLAAENAREEQKKQARLAAEQESREEQEDHARLAANLRPTRTLALSGLAVGVIAVTAAVLFLTPHAGRIAVTVADSKGSAILHPVIYVDGKKQCELAPCIVSNVAAGSHILRVEAVGFEAAAEKSVAVESRRDTAVDFALVASKAGLKVTGTQPGVRLFIDDREIGLLPQELTDVPPGTHQVKIAGAGDRYAPFEKTITVNKDEIQDLGLVTLTVVKGKATISLETPGAKVLIVKNGSDRRELPMLPISIDLDTSNQWSLVASKPSFNDYNQPISFDDGQAEKAFVVALDRAPSHPLAAPTIRQGETTVNGRLSPEVIQRIVRYSFGRFRGCYENGLRTNPNLAGRVAVKFVVDPSGSVSSVFDAGSDMPDFAVINCVVRSFANLSFPQPEGGGSVTVVYPIDFKPGG